MILEFLNRITLITFFGGLVILMLIELITGMANEFFHIWYILLCIEVIIFWSIKEMSEGW